ncbi:MAG: winged helix-turn-helix domain-containing protein [Halobacteriales archaeon]|nr:winged helix-turn-helix domain-containing protein [Halobacteriales archaeon]
MESKDIKRLRKENASGWLELTKSESVPLMIDALIDAPPEYRFNKTELQNRSGVNRNTVSKYIDLLVELGIIEKIPDTEPQEYRLNELGRVTQEILELNNAINAIRLGQDVEVKDEEELSVNVPDTGYEATRDILKISQ